MAEKVKVWFDPEGDFLEVRFSDAPGSMLVDSLHQRVMGGCSGSAFSASAVFARNGLLKQN